MSGEADKLRDARDAQTILQCGWRQGSVFDPHITDQIALPFALAADEVLMICTQSCSVVSTRFNVDPNVEVMAVKPIKHFNTRAPEATGKNRRKLHVALLQPSEAIKALECDINRRGNIPRKTLLGLQLHPGFAIGEVGATQVAAWVSGNYNRIALPNLLVERMGMRLRPTLERCLGEPKADGSGPVHQSISYIYIDWQPRDENAPIYHLNLLFIGEDRAAVDQLDEALQTALEPFFDPNSTDGITLHICDCKLASATFLTDLNGYVRLSEWDYLSNLADTVDGPL